MIVREHDPGAAVSNRVRNDLADRESCLSLVALVARDMEAVRLIVDMRHPQGLAARILFCEAPGEEITSSRETIELQWKFGTLVVHAA
jgi:hypothetical protein